MKEAAVTDAIEVVINKLQEIVEKTPPNEGVVLASATSSQDASPSASEDHPTVTSEEPVVVKIPGLSGQITANSTEKLLDALQKINSALGKVTAKTPISEARPQKSSVTGETIYKCEQCDYWSHNKYYWKQHVDLVHNAERVYKCPFCDYAGKRSHSLKEHLVVHSNYRPYECGLCNASFRKKGNLTNHIKMHSQLVEDTKCSICLVTTPSRTNLFTHLRTMHPAASYLCDYCLYATTIKTNIVVHMHAHDNPVSYCCKVCGTQAPHVDIIKEHMEQKHLNSEAAEYTTNQSAKSIILMKCTECGFTAGSTDALRQHMLKHVEPVIPTTAAAMPVSSIKVNKECDTSAPWMYQCAQCQFTCQQASQFINHMLGHQQPKIAGARAITGPDGSTGGWYQCTLCGYIGQQRTIKAHVWKHSGHKDVTYPMFQNGPLSVYDETPIGVPMLKSDSSAIVIVDDANATKKEVVVEIVTMDKDVETKVGKSMIRMCVPVRKDTDGDKEDTGYVECDERVRIVKMEAVIPKDEDNCLQIDEYQGEKENAMTLVSKRKFDSVENGDFFSPEIKHIKPEQVESVEILLQDQEDRSMDIECTEHFDVAGNLEIGHAEILHENSGLELEEAVVEVSEVEVSTEMADSSEQMMQALQSRSHSKEEVLALLAMLQAPNSEQPKQPGICNALLTVIEQLRAKSAASDDNDGVELSDDDDDSSTDATVSADMEQIGDMYHCQLCNYSSTEPLTAHVNQFHGKFECSICHLVTESSCNLQQHMIQHCKMRKFQCKQCLSTLNSKSQLRAHVKTHAVSSSPPPSLPADPNRCDKCCEVFASADQLLRHDRSCMTGVSCEVCSGYVGKRRRRPHRCRRLYHCEECDDAFGSLTALHQHSKLHPQQLHCEFCDFEATSVRSLKSHMKRHSNDQRFVEQPLEQYKCNLCGYICHHLPALKSHMWRHASDQNYSYEQTNGVINHALGYSSSSKNSSVITFRCCQCGFESINKDQLAAHMHTHRDIIEKTLAVNRGHILGKMADRISAEERQQRTDNESK